MDKLRSSTLYKFMVYKEDTHGILHDPVTEASIKTLPPDDNNPTSLNAMVISDTSITLEWNDAKVSFTKTINYTVACTNHPGLSFSTSNTRITIQKLSPTTNYVFQVKATKADGSFYPNGPIVRQSTWSKVSDNPSSVTAEPLSSTSIHLSWNAAALSEQTLTFYKVVTNSDKKNAKETAYTNITIQNLSPSTDYVFTVYATTDHLFLHEPGAKVQTKTLDEDAK
uniref:Fibronectin type-III domain-containing protein n=1 Tax=Schistocephalus solidus TaxID=70667 RepID=A0A0X3NUG3_SCHSO